MSHRRLFGTITTAFWVLFLSLHTVSTFAQTRTYKGKIYKEAKVLDFESHQKFNEGTSHITRTYHIRCEENIYSVERHGFTNGDLMKVSPGDTIYILPEGKNISILVDGKESKYMIVGIKPVAQ
jgi:hypothetical protein